MICHLINVRLERLLFTVLTFLPQSFENNFFQISTERDINIY